MSQRQHLLLLYFYLLLLSYFLLIFTVLLQYKVAQIRVNKHANTCNTFLRKYILGMTVSDTWCNTIFLQESEKLFFKLTKKIFRFVFNIFSFFKTITSDLSFKFSFHQCSWSRCAVLFLKTVCLIEVNTWNRENQIKGYLLLLLSSQLTLKQNQESSLQYVLAPRIYIYKNLYFSVLSFLQFFANLLMKTLRIMKLEENLRIHIPLEIL